MLEAIATSCFSVRMLYLGSSNFRIMKTDS